MFWYIIWYFHMYVFKSDYYSEATNTDIIFSCVCTLAYVCV